MDYQNKRNEQNEWLFIIYLCLSFLYMDLLL